MTENKEENGLVKYQARDGSEIKLSSDIVKRYLVGGNPQLLTDQELYMFMGLCKSRQLNPFIKDCHLVKYTANDPAAIITSIDYYRKRARAQPDCVGWTGGIILRVKGELQYRTGCILLESEELIGGWFEATPKHWITPMRKEVPLKRYIKTTKEGRPTRFWAEDCQPEMIAKVAESQGLRATWPDEFQGLYTSAEISDDETGFKPMTIPEQDERISDAGVELKWWSDVEGKLAQKDRGGLSEFAELSAKSQNMGVPEFKHMVIEGGHEAELLERFKAWQAKKAPTDEDHTKKLGRPKKAPDQGSLDLKEKGKNRPTSDFSSWPEYVELANLRLEHGTLWNDFVAKKGQPIPKDDQEKLGQWLDEFKQWIETEIDAKRG